MRSKLAAAVLLLAACGEGQPAVTTCKELRAQTVTSIDDGYITRFPRFYWADAPCSPDGGEVVQ